MSFINRLGFFQFDNLVRNRVSFWMLNVDVNVADLYTGIEKSHIERYSILTTQNHALSAVLEKNLVKESGIVVICADEKKSDTIAKELEKHNFTNVFVVKNGFQGIKNKEELYG